MGGKIIGKELHIFGFEVESDSLLLVHMLQKKVQPVWTLWYYWQEIWKLVDELQISISHTFWEKNGVAEDLAKAGSISRRNEVFLSDSSLPRSIRVKVFQENLGIINIRRGKSRAQSAENPFFKNKTK